MKQPVSEACRAALVEAKRHASEIVAGAISPYTGAQYIASGLGDCYGHLGQDIELVDLLGAFSAFSDEYQELAVDPVKTREIDKDVVAAAREFMQMADASGLGQVCWPWSLNDRMLSIRHFLSGSSASAGEFHSQ